MTPHALTAAAVLFAVLSVMLGIRSPPAQLRRTAAHERLGPARGRLTALLAGRPGVPPPARRGLVAGGAGVAVVALAVSLEVRPLWPVVAVSVVLAGAVVVALGYLEPASVRRRHEQLVRDLPQALDLLAAALEAGLPLRRATEAVVGVFDGPVGEDLSRVLIAVNLGIGEARAWRELGADPTWRRAAGDVARSVESGSMTVETLRQHAAGARAARRAQIEVTAKAVGVRSVLPLMLCFMPAFILIGIIPTVASAMLAALF